MFSKQFLKLFGYFLVFTLAILFLCTLSNPFFFTIDDSQNEYLGFMRQYGESWKQGEIPFITKNIFIGSNAMVELQRAIFAPHNIIASLLTASTHWVTITGLFFAFIDILMILLAGYLIGRAFEIKPALSIILGLSLAINPIYLYQYAGPWWNAANGHALAMLAIASLFWLVHRPSKATYLFNFIMVTWLLISGWPHGFIGYFIIAICYIGFTSYRVTDYKTWKQSCCYAMPTFCAILCVLPIYSEFIALRHFTNRFSEWSNVNHFLVPSLSQLLFSFSPSYYDHMNFFGGYRPLFLPIGFSTLLFIFALFFIKIDFSDRKIRFIGGLALIFLILCQLPSQTGILRYPIRFIPFFSFILCLFTFYTLSHYPIRITQQRRTLFFTLIVTFLIISILTSLFESKRAVVSNFLTFLLILYTYFLFFRNGKIRTAPVFSLATLPFACLLIMLFTLHSLGGLYMYAIKLPTHLHHLAPLNLNGYVLSFSQGGEKHAKELTDINSAQLGYYDIKSIIGYSPNGQKQVDALFRPPVPQFFLEQDQILPAFMQPTDLSGNPCLINLFNVSTLVLHENTNLTPLRKCGFNHFVPAPRNMFYATSSLNNPTTLSYSNTPTVKVRQESNNKIELVLPDNATTTRLIFVREFWPGYRASGLSCPVTLSGFQGLLLSAEIPAHCSGILTLSYFPTSWNYMLYFPVIGILLFTGCLIFFRKQEILS